MTDKKRLYVGTYTEPILFGTGKIVRGKGEGIYLYEVPISGRDHLMLQLIPGYQEKMAAHIRFSDNAKMDEIQRFKEIIQEQHLDVAEELAKNEIQ